MVAACSYEARAFGIHSAMPSAKARQLCPHAIFVKSTRGEYSRYSRWVRQIIADRAPQFEQASVDEFYLDLTGMDKFFDPLQWTIELREEIMRQTGLPISFGLSSNKMMAKIATNQAKPNGYLHVPFGKEEAFLAPLNIDEIPGVGGHTHEILKYLGIHQIRDVQKFSAEELEEKLGVRGPDLLQKSKGLHFSEVSGYHEAKSVSTENTFDEPKLDMEFLSRELVRFTEKITHELRQDGKLAGCVSVKIRYPDFETTSRQTTIDFTAADDEIIPAVKQLFKKLHRPGKPVRLLGVRLSELTGDAVQANLFIDAEKKTDLYKSIDDVKKRFGKDLLRRASGG